VRQPSSVAVDRSRRYAGHVGIQFALSSKLRQFSYEELEFSLPQLCQLVVSTDTESMALEEFILDLCEESVNAALLVSVRVPWSSLTSTDVLALPDVPP
jgi:phosphatidylinositol 4-kinase B